ncbi:Aquaporin-9 [Takifugu flavidus]|uniref:Aquaporin-9 n=1 Tax=Takifugu flavidus TaxID=433684 RepID=A0A5C6P887_9TELE|nr:Aquaporin-9 [Takifugu flavidus]
MRKRCAIKHGIFKEFLAEFLGTFVLVLFGCGSVAQTVLSRNTLGEPLTVHIGFSVGLMMAAYVAGGCQGAASLGSNITPGTKCPANPIDQRLLSVTQARAQTQAASSGGHVNPAVSLAMVILGKLKIWKFPFYVIAQFLGAFAGAAAVFGLYYDAFMDFTSGILSVTGINATGHIFASYPARHLSVLGGFIDQVVGTGMLVLCILAIVDGGNIGAPKGVEPLAIGLIIMAIGVSMGLNCGYPLNPARDLGPRLFTAVAGWGMEVFSTADYWWWIPVAGPMVGGVVGAVLYYLLIELHHPRDEPEKPREEEEDEEDEDEDSSLKDKYEMITMS